MKQIYRADNFGPNVPLRRFDDGERILDVNEGKMRITSVLSTQVLASDSMVLSPSGHTVNATPIPGLWLHGHGMRDSLPTHNVTNLRIETVKGTPAGDVPALVGDREYYSPGDAVKHLQTDAVTLPAVIFDMKRQGMLKGISIGFSVSKFEARKVDYRVPGWPSDDLMEMFRQMDGIGPGEALHGVEWFLNEVSDVPVGADPLALDRAFGAAVSDGRLNQRQLELLIGRECHNCGQCKTEADPHSPPRDGQRIESRSVLDSVAKLDLTGLNRRV